MRPLVVIPHEPCFEIRLQLLERRVELPPERDLIELLQDRLVETLADPVRLRALDLRPRVLEVVDRQEELVGMLVHAAAVLGPSIGQDAQQLPAFRFEERKDSIVEKIGRRDRGPRRVELREGDLRVRVDERLLVDPADALDRPEVGGVLRAQITGMLGLDLAEHLVIELPTFEPLDLPLD